MTKAIYLFPDTNLFIQCQTVEQLDWSAVTDADEIHLIVSRPIQEEIDRHKNKGHGRVQKRARATASILREALKSPEKQVVLRAEGPSVTLHVRMDLRFPDDVADRLEPSRPDDQLVGIAHSYRVQNPDRRVCVLTHDGGPIWSADMIDLPGLEIPESWLLDIESDDSQRRISSLESENRRLRATEPQFDLYCADEDGERTTKLEISVPRYKPLTESQIEELMTRIRARHPEETNFDGPERPGMNALSLAARGLFGTPEHVPATEEQIRKYREDDYPDWLSDCEKRLREFHQHLTAQSGWPQVAFVANNKGTRPARDALISIEARGSFEIMPPPYRSENDKDEEARDEQIFQSPPVAPRGKWVTRSLTDMLSGMRYMDQHRGLDQSWRNLLGPRDTRRDPNGFFWKPERAMSPKPTLQLECEQWRHGIGEEEFSFDIWFSSDGSEVRGALECTIHAENLSEPASILVPVRIAITETDTFPEAQEAVDSLGRVRPRTDGSD